MCQNTGQSLKVAWQGIPWKKVQRHVFRLQKRIYRATQRGRCQNGTQASEVAGEVMVCSTVRGASYHPGQPGETHRGDRWGQDPHAAPTMALANALHLDGTATPLRRIWIPKRGSATEKRPLGIPTQADRARQTVVRQALEPEWEAKLSPHTYGFRPGRSCHDAIGAIFTAIRFRPQYALKLDIAKCFDRIDHQASWPKRRRPLASADNSKPGSKRVSSKMATFRPPPQGRPKAVAVHRSWR